jgi:uracil-DNA glycosylase
MATLAELTAVWAGCTDCAPSQTRTTVVVGDGNPAADLMFVGEAPGLHEDQQGVPFVGQAGKLLDELLETIGLTRAECYIANVLKCRPPGNRDPQPEEIAACQGKLHAQIAVVQPRLICTLGNFATKLLSGRDFGVTRVHGQARRATLGGNRVVLYPLYHPAAALYNQRLRPELEHDVRRIPDLLRMLVQDGELADVSSAVATAAPERVEAASEQPPHEPEQLGLF